MDISLDSSNNSFLIMDNSTEVVYEYDSSGEYVGIFLDPTVDEVYNITSFDYDPTNDVYYLLSNSPGIVYVYDGEGEIVDTYNVESAIDTTPMYLEWDDEEGVLLVLGIESTTYVVYEFEEGVLTNSIDISNEAMYPTGLAVGGGNLWVTDGYGIGIAALNRSDGSPVGFISTADYGSGNPIGLEYLEGDGGALAIIDDYNVYLVGTTFDFDFNTSGITVDEDDDSYLLDFGWFSTVFGSTEQILQGFFFVPAYIALKFSNVEVSQGAVITSATLRLAFIGGAAGSYGVLYGHDTDDAPAWSEVVTPVTMATTSASMPFLVDADNEIYELVNFDVTDIVQEIVNRSGWESGNSVAFGGDPVGVEENYASFLSYETASSIHLIYAPTLFIEVEEEEEEPPARELRLEGGVRLMNGVRLY